MFTDLAPGPVTRQVCANFGADQGGCCAWSDTIQVKWCPPVLPDDSDPYFVYQLKAPVHCDVAYCAGDSEVCPIEEKWVPDQSGGRCEGRNIALSLLYQTSDCK